MPKRRAQPNFPKSAIRNNKQQAYLPQAIAFGDDHAISVISHSFTSTASLRITQTGTGNALEVGDASDPDSTPFVIDQTGTILIGHTAIVPSALGATPKVSIHNTVSELTNELALYNWNSTATANAYLMFNRSFGDTAGSHLTVSANVILGQIGFNGSNGTEFKIAAEIKGECETASGSVVQGRLSFHITGSGDTRRKVMAFKPDRAASISGTLNVKSKLMVDGDDVQHVIDEVVFTYVNTDPATLFGYGTWSSLGSGSLFSAVVYSWRRTA